LRSLVFLFFISCTPLFAQLPITEEQFNARIKPGSVLPEKLLSSRTAVFYNYLFTTKELELAQTYFQQSGIDAVIYLDDDLVIAGRDVCVATAQYLNSREISNLIFLKKSNQQFSLTLVEYNRKANFIEEGQVSWNGQDRVLEELCRRLYLASAAGLKRENFLINDFPETDASVNPLGGRRNEFYAVDLKVDALAVPKFNDPEKDRELEEIMKTYPFKFTFTDPNLSEADLRKQGFLYVLRFVQARAKVAKALLLYDMTKSESALVSFTYPGDQAQLKNIPANEQVFKFYFKHIESQNVFLGTKWDADISWQQALVNQIKGYKIEFKLN
jgi:hypothetical protein